ncbi:MAG: tetratricopeptide repeat protein [candidate division KSB1 bacterium]|nr:tetratricopeptide repeat protein [candidate division KSB1 bacterium]
MANTKDSFENNQFSIQEKIATFLKQIEPRENSCEVTIKSLQNLIYELVDEQEQELRIDFLDRSSSELFERFKGLLNRPQEIQIKLWLASHYELLGAYQKALKSYQNVIELCESDDFYREKAEALRWAGHIRARRNQWQEAFKLLDKCLNICLEHEDIVAESRARNLIGLINFERGEYEYANTHWQKALELSDHFDNNRLTASYYHNLGISSNVRGDFEKLLPVMPKHCPGLKKSAIHAVWPIPFTIWR